MKIRTDFVTNSSSVSTAEIVIDNPMLLEILQRYKDMGAFGESPFFGIGEYISGNEVSGIKTPAFQYSEDLYGEGWPRLRTSPKTLAKVLGGIISIIDDNSEYNKKLIDEMKAELSYKRAEILAEYKKISWNFKELQNEDGWQDGHVVNLDYCYEFSFDPLKGEEYHYIEKTSAGLYKTNEEARIWAEQHIVNGTVMVNFGCENHDDDEDRESDEEYKDEEDDE